MLDQALAFKHIRRLQIKALRHVNDMFAGIYRSTFKGKGLEFEDVREYQQGDDIRTIDWNVSARSQSLFVKNFREERELTVMLVIDISASSLFGHHSRLKNEMIAELAALIAFSATKNQDNVGLLLFSGEIELYLKPKKGIRHVLRVIRELLYFVPRNRNTDLQQALSFLGKVQRKQVICFLISDFLTDKDFSHQAALIAQRHELVAFHIFDSYEENFTPQALFTLKDLETQEEIIVDTTDKDVQKIYREKRKAQRNKIKKIFERIGVGYLLINTEEATTSVLQRFFSGRRGKL